MFNDPEPAGESGGVAPAVAVVQAGESRKADSQEPSTGGRPRARGRRKRRQPGGRRGQRRRAGGRSQRRRRRGDRRGARLGRQHELGGSRNRRQGQRRNVRWRGRAERGSTEHRRRHATGGEGNQEDPAEPLANAFCAAARHCCDAAGLGTAGLSDCEAQLAVQLLNFELTREGVLEVDAPALDACVAAIEDAATSCALTGLLSLCRQVWHGTKQEGEPCTDVSQCDRTDGPKFCVRNLETGSQSEPGVCAGVPRGQDAQPCSQSCAEGADCSTNFSSFEAEPVTTLCHEADGVYCAFGNDEATCAPLTARGSPCDSSSQCAAADFCDTTCQPRSAGGEACQFSFGCSADLLCMEGVCADAPLATAELCAGNLGSSGLN